MFAAQTMMRASDLKDAGIGAQTIARALEDGELERLSRGIYQHHDADMTEHHSLAEAALRFVRFTEPYLRHGIGHHRIAGVNVPVYSVAKTLADMFRNGKLVDRSIAVEGRAAITQRRVTPSALAEGAKLAGAWNIMRPYLEAFTAHG
jgi:predicted transcriptional regulator of viral defense system